jgi:hypothetical protein
MIPIPPHIWNADAAREAAYELDTEINVIHVIDAVLVWVDDVRAWVDLYVSLMQTIIEGEGPEVVA